MAQTLPPHKYTIFTIFLFSILLHGESHKFSRNLSPKSLGLKKQKLSHLHFYFQDIVGGDHPTALKVAQSPITNISHTGFGYMVMIDDPLTVGPERTSKIVGRAQGIYASADLNQVGLLMVMNYVFIEGKYNGSTLSILGRNSVFLPVRELPIVGGSGLFRFARGYALAKTHSFNISNGDATVEYNVYVQHY
ncbi:dirigent protein 21 [Lactuca sativa]|uniref:dirigent protein 21 n=1 Tax=Lactuca sativa TaxID=4236 RepID=UPI000CD9F673|nr:dirigent protein 21 [Lactuca sativa]